MAIAMTNKCKSLLSGLAIVFLAGCPSQNQGGNTGTNSSGASADVAKVAAILPLTGSLSFLGEPGKNALAMAEERINSEGRARVKVELYDSKADPKEAVTAAQRATDIDGAKFLLTTLTGPSLAVKPVAQSKKALQQIVAIYPEVARGSSYALQACYSAEQEAKAIVDRVKSKGIKQVFFLYSLDPVSEVEVRKYIRPPLEQAGVKTQEQTFDVGNKSFSSQVLRLKQSGIRNVILLGYGSDFPAVLKEMSAQGILGGLQIIGGIGYLELPDYVSYNMVKNAVFASPEFNINPQGSLARKEFVSAYKTRFKKNVVTYDAGYTYDALMVLADALANSTDKSPEAVRNYLLNRGSFEGVTGRWTFTKEGNLVSPMALAKFTPKMDIAPAR